MKYQFITNCIQASYEITYKTFCKYVDWKEISKLLGYALHPKQGLMLKNDWAVSYHKSQYMGKPCYFVCWSAIEYIFQKEIL